MSCSLFPRFAEFHPWAMHVPLNAEGDHGISGSADRWVPSSNGGQSPGPAPSARTQSNMAHRTYRRTAALQPAWRRFCRCTRTPRTGACLNSCRPHAHGQCA
eukprot:scaffold132992_cov78-Phaeocystis_antarctica.AAC.2